MFFKTTHSSIVKFILPSLYSTIQFQTNMRLLESSRHRRKRPRPASIRLDVEFSRGCRVQFSRGCSRHESDEIIHIVSYVVKGFGLEVGSGFGVPLGAVSERFSTVLLLSSGDGRVINDSSKKREIPASHTSVQGVRLVLRVLFLLRLDDG